MTLTSSIACSHIAVSIDHVGLIGTREVADFAGQFAADLGVGAGQFKTAHTSQYYPSG